VVCAFNRQHSRSFNLSLFELLTVKNQSISSLVSRLVHSLYEMASDFVISSKLHYNFEHCMLNHDFQTIDFAS